MKKYDYFEVPTQVKFWDGRYIEACGLRSEAEDIDNWMNILENFIGTIQEREDCND